MDNHSRKLLALMNSKSKVSPVIGSFIRMEQNGSIVVVATAPGEMPVKCRPMSDYRPEPLEPVVVFFVDGVAWYVGAAKSKPSKGTVATVSGGLATVVTDIGTVACSYGTAPSSGNNVRLLWNDGPHIVDVVSTFPVQQVVPSDPVYQPTPHTFTFKAIMSGTVRYPYDSGTGVVSYPGTFYPGGFSAAYFPPNTVSSSFWFYGPSIHSTIPVGATIVAAEMFFPGGTNIPAIFTTPSKTVDEAILARPTGLPSYFPTGNIVVADGTGGSWVNLGPTFGAAVAATELSIGPSSGGSPSARMRGLDLLGDGSGDNMSGAIRITALF